MNPEKWLDDHGDKLYAYALERVREKSVAEDLVQETLLSAMNAIDTFRGDAKESTWLIGILKHKVLDYFRRSYREKSLSDYDEQSSTTRDWFDEQGQWSTRPGAWHQPERSLEQVQFWNTLQQCIDELPEKTRIAYMLREFDGIDTSKLINTLHISSQNNLWVMLSRARLQLRHCLEKNWFMN